jgi:hypothetical protein
MATVKMQSKFIMSQEDINLLNTLPPNFPETHLTPKQKELVNSIYHKYLRREIVSNDLLKELYELEQKEMWPGGERVKKHEAQRLVLEWLVDFNRTPEPSMERAVRLFYTNLKTCEPNRILITAIYQIML